MVTTTLPTAMISHAQCFGSLSVSSPDGAVTWMVLKKRNKMLEMMSRRKIQWEMPIIGKNIVPLPSF